MNNMNWNLVHLAVAKELQRLGATLIDSTVPKSENIYLENDKETITLTDKYLCLEYIVLDHSSHGNYDENDELDNAGQFDFSFPLDHEIWNTHDYEQDAYIIFGDYCNAHYACIYIKDQHNLSTGNPTVKIFGDDIEEDDAETMLLSEFLVTQY